MKKLFIGIIIWILMSAPCYGAEVDKTEQKEEFRKYCITKLFELRDELLNFREQQEAESKMPASKIYDVPQNRGFKSYMPYTAITSTGSKQYKLQHQYAYTGNYGIRQVNDRYCIALGTYYTDQIGQELDLILENGVVIPCILADQKANVDTDSSNKITLHNGCVAEFVVDRSSLYRMAKRMGDISFCCDEWNSPVSKIRVYDRNVFETY